jgi:hypothetical protein
MSFARRNRFVAASLACAGLSAFSYLGCVDPQGTFDAFGERYDKINGSSSSSSGSGGGSCMAPMAGAADGDYLFALSAKINPKKAITLLMNVTTVASGDGLKMTFKETPLSYMDQKTPVGPQVDLGTFDVAADGSFTAAIASIDVPGAANPITVGADISAAVTISGQLCAADLSFVCGTVDGNVTKPLKISLTGSTFSMQKVEGGNVPPPLLDCAKTPAMYN